MSYLYNIFFRGLTLGLLLFLSFSDEAQVQENDRAFLLLKEKYAQALAKKDQENDRRITIITTTAVIVVTVLLVVLGAIVISRQRLKVRNERLTGERDRQIYEAQRELMQAELQNRHLQEERLMQQEKQLQQMIRHVNLNFNHDQYWHEFRETFGQVHQQFFDHLKAHCEDLTGNDLRLLSLIKLNLASGDIATLLGISQDSLRVSRYRLKKKLSLNNGESLTAFVHSL